MAVLCDCGRPACIELAYTRQSYCPKHFCEFFSKRIKRTIREFSMLKGVKKLGVALSGGKDSLTLLHVLAPLCAEMRIELHAITVDEGIGGYRGNLVAIAQKECKKLGVKHHLVSFKNALGFSLDEATQLEKRKAACSYCGVFRRWLLNRKARELSLDRLAIGHNLDDAAQTVLMNMLRNEPSRLARFSPNGALVESEEFVDRIRPLLRTPEREIAVYAILKKFPMRFGDCPYAGEAFRNEVRNFLNGLEVKYPGTKFRVLNSFLSMKKSLKGKKGRLHSCKSCGEPSSRETCMACQLAEEVKNGL